MHEQILSLVNSIKMTNTEIKNFSEGAIPTSIAPWLPVRNGMEAVTFYKSAFGALEAYRLEDPDGGLVVKLSVDGAVFWLSGGPADTGDGNSNAASAGAGPVRMVLTVSDPDAVFARALEAGASLVFPVGEEYGWRLGRLVDPFGYHWEIGHPLNTRQITDV